MALADIYIKYKARRGYGDKGTTHRYIDSYEVLFSPLKDEPVVLLEIGVSRGHSLKMWREYFEKAIIIGIDIQLPTLDLCGCEFHLCNQTNTKRLHAILNGRKLDIVIDDGSHKLEDQILSFQCLFPIVNTGGLYIIEDIQNPLSGIPTIKRELGECEVVDTRQQSGRYDDVLLIWRK